MNGAAEIISSIGAATSSILAGAAVIYSASARRHSRKSSTQTAGTNGRTLAQQIDRVEGDVTILRYRVGKIEKKIGSDADL